MATQSSILAWRIPGTEEPCGLLSMGIYDLTGRQVNAVERGIYIVNGNKVLVK